MSLVFLADSVFVLHGAFAVLVAPSALLALAGRYASRPVLWNLHNLSITVMVSGQLLLRKCPLVALEQTLRNADGREMPYTGSFVRYVVDHLTGITLPAGSVMALSVAIALVSIAALVRHWPYGAPKSALSEA